MKPGSPSQCKCWLAGSVLAALAAYWVMIFVATHIPLDKVPRPDVVMNNDKLAHLGAYTGLGFWLLLAGSLRWRPSLRLWMSVLLVAAGYGALDEMTQAWVGRTTDFYDWTADIVGAAGGGLLGMLIAPLVRRWIGAPDVNKRSAVDGIKPKV